MSKLGSSPSKLFEPNRRLMMLDKDSNFFGNVPVNLLEMVIRTFSRMRNVYKMKKSVILQTNLLSVRDRNSSVSKFKSSSGNGPVI